MFRCTPLTPEKAFRLEKKCKEAIIALTSDIVNERCMNSLSEHEAIAIARALDFAEDWKSNIDDSLYMMSMEPRPEFIDKNSMQAKELLICSHAINYIFDNLYTLKENIQLCNKESEAEVPKKKDIDKRYYTQHFKGKEIPPQYWCFAYKCEECSKGQILDQLKQSRYCNEITDIEIVNAFLPENPLLPPDPSYNTGYTTCGRIYFENGATRNILKELFPGATIYMGKNAHIFYEQYVKEYYGPTYSLCNPNS